MKSMLKRLKDIENRIPRRKKKTMSIEKREKLDKVNAFMNRYSLIFHAMLSGFLILAVECISRRSLLSAGIFADAHTKAYIYNSFIIFCSLSMVYLLKRRALARIIISGFWIFLGTVNGCVLSNRVTPFGYCDLKCIKELLAMEDSNYFTVQEAMLVVAIVGAFLVFCVWFFIKGPKFQGKRRRILTPLMVCGLFLVLPVTTKAAQNSKILDTYFDNLAEGYENNGFVYAFSTSVVDRGMSKPKSYSEESVQEALLRQTKEITTNDDNPNIVVVLLESFVDPDEVKFLECSEDPIPNFHELEENYSSGYLTVPVVGAGTSNTEFEILTGMSMQYFGTGEYPYKTILKQTDCESIASDLSQIGYGTHVVHNNGGNFYSRANAFSMMGFDTFTSKELMNIQQYTPLGNWPTDNILINEAKKALDSTKNQSDFVYSITVQGHGDYPTYQVIENPEVTVTGCDTDAENYQWEYYVNMIHEVDKYIGNLEKMLEERDENTILVLFGDHLPSLSLDESDMKSGSIYKTKYVTWNNFGLEKEDADLTAYELLANVTDQVGIHEGTVFTYEQNALKTKQTETETYKDGLELLQYDLLYGSRYAYGGEDLYPASDLVMGIDEVTIDDAWLSSTGEEVAISGSNFTNWSRVYVNGKKVTTAFQSSSRLRISADSIKNGDTIVVSQVGSEETRFRDSNEYIFDDPNAEPQSSGVEE